MEHKDKRIKDVEKIFLAGNTQIETKSDLAKIIEEPCLSVCEELYDKNILTYWSSSNKGNPNKSFICIRYDSLDNKNKAIADKMLEDGKIKISPYDSGNNIDDNYGKGLLLSITSHPDMLVSDVSQQLSELASAFKHQDILYNVYSSEYIASKNPAVGNKKIFGYPDLEIAVCGEEYTDNHQPWRKRVYDNIRFGFGVTKEDKSLDMEKIAEQLGWLYNAEDNKIYKDSETLCRHNEFMFKDRKSKNIDFTLLVRKHQGDGKF